MVLSTPGSNAGASATTHADVLNELNELSLQAHFSEESPASTSTMAAPALPSDLPSDLPDTMSSPEAAGQTSGVEDSSLPLFNTPGRSIFSSGPPTSSLSANTAQASMTSRPSHTSTHPLSALTASASTSRRTARRNRDMGLTTPFRVPTIDEGNDEYSEVAVVASTDRRDSPSRSSLLRNMNDLASPSSSEYAPYVRSAQKRPCAKGYSSASAELPDHIYERGFLGGKHSDVVVVAFGVRYPLHRIVLDRAPFFSTAFSEPWAESSATEITLHPEDTDPNITREAFELALQRIYGYRGTHLADADALGLFATGCWLEMAPVVESSVAAILRQMTTEKVSRLIHFFTDNYYGKVGDLLLESAKAVLCRDGHDMPIEQWDDIPAPVIAEVVAGDAFYVPGEWERYRLAKQLLNRKLQRAADEVDVHGDAEESDPATVPSPDVLRRKFEAKGLRASAKELDSPMRHYIRAYDCEDVQALVHLIQHGIHYMHLTFEQLQKVKKARDHFGLSLVPDSIVAKALWASMELRQKIQRADRLGAELGLTEKIEDPLMDVPAEAALEGFPIPTVDSVSSVGATHDAISDTYNGVEPPDVMPTRASGQTSEDRSNAAMADHVWNPPSMPPSPPSTRSVYPPFRFSVEFASPRVGKRVYSPSFWYAGSLWCMYIQSKDRSTHVEPGVYLHRMVSTDSARLANIRSQDSLNQHILALQRDLSTNDPPPPQEGRLTQDNLRNHESDVDFILPGSTSAHLTQRSTSLSELLNRHSNRVVKASSLFASPGRGSILKAPETDDEAEVDSRPPKKSKSSTLPPYVDGRQFVQTYFRIYTPSKSGRMISVYESAPIIMNGRQSWGWRSGSLLLDDTIEGQDEVKSKDGKIKFMVVLGVV